MNLYIIGGVVIAFLLMGLGIYHYRDQALTAGIERDAAIRDKNAAVDANTKNEAARLKAEADRVKAEKIAADLQDQIDAANQSTLNLANELTELRAHNAAVNDYLNTLIPDDVRRVYDKPETASRH